MKKIVAIVLLVVVLALLSACGIIPGGEPEATWTPLPTYTLLPTYTPFPSPTATFLPSPTSIPPTETASVPTPDPSLPSVTPEPAFANQATLAFGSNMREAPDTSSEVITTVAAGEPLQILGRDLSGLWLLVATNDGFEGWIRITQFQGRIDVPRIPLADSIPTPAASPSPTSDLTITATTVVETAPDEILFEIQNDGKRVCQEFRWFLPGKLGVPSDSVDIRQYETTNAASIVGQKSFRFVRSAEIPTFIQFEVDGPMKATNCTNNECSSVDMTICGFAFADAVTGGFVYRSNVFFQFGTQSYTDFFTEIETRIPLGFTVEKAQ